MHHEHLYTRYTEYNLLRTASKPMDTMEIKAEKKMQKHRHRSLSVVVATHEKHFFSRWCYC